MKVLLMNFRYSVHWFCLERFPDFYFVVSLPRQVWAIRMVDADHIEEAPEMGSKNGMEVNRAV